MNKKLFYILSSLLIAFGLQAQFITISGSNTMLSLFKSISSSYNRDNITEIKITGEGSSAGIDDFISKKNDIAMVSRKLRADEIAILKSSNIDYEFVPIALDALCIVVNSNLRASVITFAELENIYNGTTKNWMKFGDVDLAIKPIVRDKKSGTADFFKEMVIQNSTISASNVQFSTTSAITYAIHVSKEYIGYVGCAFVDEHIKSLSIKTQDGVFEPNEENIKSRKYPLTRELYLLYAKNSSKDAKLFVDYCKSAIGKKIILSNGFLLLPQPW